MVSGTLSLPSRGTFHHSLTVLSTIGHQEVFRLSEWSRQIHSTLHGNAATREHHHTHHSCFHLPGSHRLRPTIPDRSPNTSSHAGRLVDLPNGIPQPRACNPYQVSHIHGLASSAFARHYSRNHQCFLFLRVLRCFTSPRSPQHPIHSDAGNPASPGLGYPIRTPSDHSSVDNSPRTIAASHVLHRLLVPRHPPCAPQNLATKMLAPTIQFSNNNPRKQPTHPTPNRGRRACSLRYPTANQSSTPAHQGQHGQCVPQSIEHPSNTTHGHSTWTLQHPAKQATGVCSLLRKEVIQPHLPVRLPCYDFVPIASPTFDHSPHTGWAMGFGCYRLS